MNSPISPIVLRPPRWVFGLTLVVLVVALSACAMGRNLGKVEHGFAVENKGESLIRNVVITYGGKRINFCDTQCYAKRSSGFYGVYMPIQEQMHVSWQTADGLKHEVLVPVKQRVRHVSRLDVLFLQFNGNELIVLQGLHHTKPGLVGLERAPLFP